MKRVKMIFMVMATMLATMSFQSCLDDDDDNAVNYPNALVTLKTNPADGTFFMQLDDSTTILPTNMKTSPYGNKEVRALANFKIGEGQSGHYSKSAYVNWIDSIRTKAMAPNLGDKNDATYGTDPVEIVRDWTTVVEDGYLTLRFRTYFGGMRTHIVNLVKTDKPYEVRLYHNAVGDFKNRVQDGLIAFRLSDLPDTGGKEVYLTLKWRSFSGEKSVKFKYRTRK